jgi:REP element-mobilizing transposase RayT
VIVFCRGVERVPRQARKRSRSGIYHVMLRGINQQTIFEDDEDKERLIATLEKYREICGYKLYAYCLMSNHFHILVKGEKEDLSLIVKRIAGSYVYWYNRKYKRCGHLFQDRYKSEAVDNDSYFLAVLRYIHNNPVVAGICESPCDYRFSSYPLYVKNESGLLDLSFVFSMLSKDEFERFHKEEKEAKFLENEVKDYPIRDSEAIALIKEVTRCSNLVEIQMLERDKLNITIKLIRDKGISIRQLSRITGISKGIIESIIRQ